ncbi:MAG: ATP-binding protein [Planctomycetota bacterium]|jgi:signal transduction histidine kinase/CheY-like chemotaxis protein|nr:ATP-binding protein [Planctomycetota bacterium]
MSIISSQLREEDRLLALRQTGLLDSADESIFDEQTRLLADVCGCPIAALSLVDRDRLYLKSKTGMDFCELDRHGSFCEKVALSGAPVLVQDATKDPEFCDTSLVRDVGVCFYAGVPVEVFPGCAIGSLCVLGMEPCEVTPLMMETLETLASQVGHVIALRRQLMLKGRIHTESLMTAGAMHEIKNTLTPAMGYLDLLAEGGNHEGTVKERCEWLKRASEAVVQTVEMLRDMRLGKHAASPCEGAAGQCMGEVVSGVIRQIDSAAETAGINIRWYDRSGEDAQVDCMGNELRQIVSNLILNGMDAMPDGGMLDISTKRGGDRFMLTVTDNGKGMTPTEAGQCFDPLFSTKQVGAGYGGSGIGLTIVKQIVCDQGGSIQVDSELGAGTTMRVELPCAKNAGTAKSNGEAPEACGLRILVVDDQPMVLKTVGTVLSSLGHSAILYEDPEEACRHFASSPTAVDLAIVDLGMTPINGLQLAERLHSVREELPVIIATGEDLNTIELPRQTRHIDKPFRLAQLRETLKHAMCCD